MTEYELTDVMYTIFSSMNESAALYFTLVSAYIGMSFLIGERLTRFQLVIINILYVVWMTGVINTGFAQLGNVIEITQALDSMDAIVVNQSIEVISFSVYAFVVVQLGGVAASILFMRSVRHPRTE
jgi:hypothetical protein